jgi:hypothetical protein
MAEARKTVTVVFADVSGSTALGERLDPDALRRLIAEWRMNGWGWSSWAASQLHPWPVFGEKNPPR